MIEVIRNCQVEWDKSRGVLYVHDGSTGATVLRVCGLKKIEGTGPLLRHGQIDVTHPKMVSYPEGT